jgi:two-component system sensor histidine kinase/response regulator
MNSMTISKPYAPTILLVDDYPAGLLVGTMLLEHLGYNVEVVTSGEEAIEKVRATTTPFMAILMDVNMEGMDGFAAIKIIREIEQEKGYSNTIIAVTAHAQDGDRSYCLDAGMNDYISKPIQADILEQKLKELANR